MKNILHLKVVQQAFLIFLKRSIALFLVTWLLFSFIWAILGYIWLKFLLNMFLKK